MRKCHGGCVAKPTVVWSYCFRPDNYSVHPVGNKVVPEGEGTDKKQGGDGKIESRGAGR